MIGSDIPYTAGRKARRRTQAIAKRYAFHANAKILLFVQACFFMSLIDNLGAHIQMCT